MDNFTKWTEVCSNFDGFLEAGIVARLLLILHPATYLLLYILKVLPGSSAKIVKSIFFNEAPPIKHFNGAMSKGHFYNPPWISMISK